MRGLRIAPRIACQAHASCDITAAASSCMPELHSPVLGQPHQHLREAQPLSVILAPNRSKCLREVRPVRSFRPASPKARVSSARRSSRLRRARDGAQPSETAAAHSGAQHAALGTRKGCMQAQATA